MSLVKILPDNHKPISFDTGTRLQIPSIFIKFLLAMAVCVSLPVLANDDADPANRLQQLRTEIKALRTELDVDQQRKQSLQSQLRNAEKHIGKLSALLKELNKQLQLQKRELKKLNREQDQLNSNLQSQRTDLAQQVRAAYAIGQQEYLKILLNQQDPAAVTRTLTYYDYFNRARLQRIQVINSKLTALKNVQQAIQEKTEKLEHNRQEQTAEKQSLEQTRSNRNQVLASLNLQIRSKGERLDILLENQKRLQGLLQKLADEALELQKEQQVERQVEQADQQPFSRLRGKLPWPTGGKLSTRFGSKRKEGSLKWQGVLINAPEGHDVTAISHGRIAFSDWLRGFGLLTIIDHGDGYMSLYGSNQSLYKEVGDWVEAGEVIASVGNSGGRQETALYFEIRHNGKPTNPLKWCKNKPKRLARR